MTRQRPHNNNLQGNTMIKNKKIAKDSAETNVLTLNLTPEQVQAEVNDLYDELERRFGAGFADSIIRRYTDVKPRQRGESPCE